MKKKNPPKGVNRTKFCNLPLGKEFSLNGVTYVKFNPRYGMNPDGKTRLFKDVDMVEVKK